MTEFSEGLQRQITGKRVSAYTLEILMQLFVFSYFFRGQLI